MRKDPREERARLSSRMANLENVPNPSRDEMKLIAADEKRLNPEEAKLRSKAIGKLMKKQSTGRQLGRLDAALQGVEDVISGAKTKPYTSALDREFGTPEKSKVYRRTVRRYRKN